MRELVLILGLMLLLEGLGPLCFPRQWQQLLSQLTRLEPDRLRRLGAALVLAGGLILWLWWRYGQHGAN